MGRPARQESFNNNSDSSESTDLLVEEQFVPRKIEEKEEVQVQKIVTIKPIPRAGKRLGLADQPENFQRMPGTSYTWVPSKKGMKYLTGLTHEEAVEYGNRLGQNLGELSDFWMDLKYTLTEKPLGYKLNLSVPLEYIIYKAMTVSELIAESLQDYRSGKKPYAEWYIENQEAEAEQKSKNADTKIEAYTKFKEISNARKKDISKILGLKPYGLSDSAAAGRLFEFIEAKIENAKSFLSVEVKKDEIIAVSALVEDAIHYNILRINKAKDYQYADEPMGSTKDQVVVKLMKPDNQVLRLKISELVESRK